MTEHFVTTWDGVRLFYRAWLPARPARQALVLFHRGHEHSGRFEDTVRQLALDDFSVFAWDARGHGRSPGERGWAESFACLVRDADCFVRHLSQTYDVPVESMAVVAHSIGAVLATAWVHDYGPPIRALVLASPAFRVKLYVPFALPFLRLRLKFQKKATVKSYVRPGMLTHDEAECRAYATDPLISRAVSVNLLVQMHDTSTRLMQDAGALRTPTLLLTSGKDYVVKLAPQREFFERLSSPTKEMQHYPGFYHYILHEKERDKPIARIRDFVIRAFERPVEAASTPRNQAEFARLSSPAPSLNWTVQRLFLKAISPLSRGIALGWRHGFDSGESLDYVYTNRPNSLVDRIYLNSPGWRGIRQRCANLETLLHQAIQQLRAAGKPIHIFDPATGGARYLHEVIQDPQVSVTLRDWSPIQTPSLKIEQGDAFDRASLAAIRPRPTICIVSGLYELFPDNARVIESLRGIADAMDEGGYFLYTNQPWHPQLEMIARVLDNREGKPWIMRCRAQAEMDALVREAGFEKQEMLLDPDGIFAVSLAQRRATAAGIQPANVRASVLLQ